MLVLSDFQKGACHQSGPIGKSSAAHPTRHSQRPHKQAGQGGAALTEGLQAPHFKARGEGFAQVARQGQRSVWRRQHLAVQIERRTDPSAAVESGRQYSELWLLLTKLLRQ